MDVPFASSGALSRAHYSIVRKVETADSPQQADQLLALEIKAVHERLARSSPTVKECKECLVILLYIFGAASPGFLPPGTFDFALAHGLNLAEVGRTVEEKRIGYLFCAELMPPQHELRLMMINTLRKDLESGSPGRMCLALDNLILFANDDILPAVQDIILDLISHNYPHVRRRAILALRSLAAYDPGLLLQGSETIVSRLQDRNESVAASALAAAADLPSSDSKFMSVRHVVNGLFSSTGVSNVSAFTLSILRCLQNIGLSETHIPFALELVKSFSSSHQPAPLLGTCRLLSQQSPSKLIEAEKAQDISAVKCIQYLLTSHDINDQYLYLACLLCVDPGVWAGTSPEQRSLVLEAWEVEKIMQFLESPDDLIRKMTLNLLVRIDPAIVGTYLTRVIESMRPGSDLQTLNIWASRMIDVIVLLSPDDGEQYGQGVKEILAKLDGVLDRPRVLQSVVEKVLVHIRTSMSDFRVACATVLLTYVVEASGSLGPTLLVISSALAVEYVASISVSPFELLRAFCANLKTSTPVVQDALLVAALRLTAECEGEEIKVITEAIEDLQQRAGPHIQRRCTQVLRHILNRDELRKIVEGLSTKTLPEFLEALERPKPSQVKRNTSSSYSEGATASSKLRYAAYEQAQPTTSLRSKRALSPLGSARSGSISDRGDERPSGSPEAAEAVSISLAAVSLGLDLKQATLVPETSTRSDLISLDSPFVTESTAEEGSISDEFERIWNALPDEQGARGWCEDSVVEVLRRLQRLEGTQVRVAPGDKDGELQVVLTEGKGVLVARLWEGADASCLWRLKSKSERLRRAARGAM